ncbi:hypothetical protein TrRE_jg711 [Triparma retinervis]|uniref:Transmembrane protein n=1 Tax=Triparma retinervis TaxID=2557542 RepID=A0A9W7E808_9STRA|nr:hypothetical protein TrRE_jg711 [Triparma retinervis]
MNDDDFEYDLDQALNNNTDPFITKVIAGSLIVVILGLLVVGVIIPLTAPIDGNMMSKSAEDGEKIGKQLLSSNPWSHHTAHGYYNKRRQSCICGLAVFGGLGAVCWLHLGDYKL